MKLFQYISKYLNRRQRIQDRCPVCNRQETSALGPYARWHFAVNTEGAFTSTQHSIFYPGYQKCTYVCDPYSPAIKETRGIRSWSWFVNPPVFILMSEWKKLKIRG